MKPLLHTALFLATATTARPCSCVKYLSPCEYMNIAMEAVVVEALPPLGWLQGTPFEITPVRAVEVLKGNSIVGSYRLVPTGGDGGLQPSHRYLLYGKYGVLFARGCCIGAFPVSEAEHWLNALRNAARNGPPLMAGTVYTAPGYHLQPLPGVHVTAECGGKRGSATTNAQGQFEIPNLARGDCSVQMEKPGYTNGRVWSPTPLRMESACAAPLLEMSPAERPAP